MKPPRAEPLPRPHGPASCAPTHVGDELRVAGWVHRRRDHGGLIFIDLRDRSGLLQLVFHPEDAPEAHAGRARPARRGRDHASSGELVAREEGTVNPNLPTGEVELAVTRVELLPTPRRRRSRSTRTSRSARSCGCATATSTCAASDAARDRRCATTWSRTIRDAPERRADFLEIETPILTSSTPEGARDFLVPSRLQPGSLVRAAAVAAAVQAAPDSPASSATTRSPAASATRTCAPTASPSSPSSTSRWRSSRRTTSSTLIDPLHAAVLALGGVEVAPPIERAAPTTRRCPLRHRPARPPHRRWRSTSSATSSAARSSRSSRRAAPAA